MPRETAYRDSQRTEEWRMSDEESNVAYTVLVNHEEQYSLWRSTLNIPVGWTSTGKVGTKAECMAYVDELWTDMRPLSLRKKMAAQAKH
jgi:MbtH protein